MKGNRRCRLIIRSEEQLKISATAILSRFRVANYPHDTVAREECTTTQYVGRGRGGKLTGFIPGSQVKASAI